MASETKERKIGELVQEAFDKQLNESEEALAEKMWESVNAAQQSSNAAHLKARQTEQRCASAMSSLKTLTDLIDAECKSLGIEWREDAATTLGAVLATLRERDESCSYCESGFPTYDDGCPQCGSSPRIVEHEGKLYRFTGERRCPKEGELFLHEYGKPPVSVAHINFKLEEYDILEELPPAPSVEVPEGERRESLIAQVNTLLNLTTELRAENERLKNRTASREAEFDKLIDESASKYADMIIDQLKGVIEDHPPSPTQPEAKGEKAKCVRCPVCGSEDLEGIVHGVYRCKGCQPTRPPAPAPPAETGEAGVLTASDWRVHRDDNGDFLLWDQSSTANTREQAESAADWLNRRAAIEFQRSELKADNNRLNSILRRTGYGQGQIDAHMDIEEENEKLLAQLATYKQLCGDIVKHIDDDARELSSCEQELMPRIRDAAQLESQQPSDGKAPESQLQGGK